MTLAEQIGHDRQVAGSGGETDVCVLATVLGGVDRGCRMILVSDALCSSTDDRHDALMNLYRERFSEQLEVTTVAEILASWRPQASRRVR